MALVPTCEASLHNIMDDIQGGFFNWDPPKNHKYWKKLKYPNWDPPKNHKYGKKLKYPNWDPPKILKYPNWDPPRISKYGKYI